MSSRDARLTRVFTENKDKTLSYGHEVLPGLFLANRHSLVFGTDSDDTWLRTIKADAVVCCAKELTEDVTALRNSEFGKLIDISLVPMEEADMKKLKDGMESLAESYTKRLEEQLREAADIILSHMSLGRRVVVACKYGYNRSASAVLSYLVLYQSTSLLDGLEKLRLSRPKVYPNVETWPSLLRIEESSNPQGSGADALTSPSLTMDEILTYHAWSPRNKR